MWNKKEISQLDATLTRVPLTLTFDLDLWRWIFKVKLYLGNGRPDCHGMKGTEVDSMHDCCILLLQFVPVFETDLGQFCFVLLSLVYSSVATFQCMSLYNWDFIQYFPLHNHLSNKKCHFSCSVQFYKQLHLSVRVYLPSSSFDLDIGFLPESQVLLGVHK